MDSKSVAAVRSRKRNAEKELALAQATKATARKRDGMDLVVAWSVVGLFVVACSAVVYAMALSTGLHNAGASPRANTGDTSM